MGVHQIGVEKGFPVISNPSSCSQQPRDSADESGSEPNQETIVSRAGPREPKGLIAHQSEFSKLGYGRGSSVLPFKRLIRDSQEYFDFLRFSRSRRRQGVEVFEETGPGKTGGAKVPFDNFDPENYLGDAGLRNAATRFAGPVSGAQGVEDAFRGNFYLRLERRHSSQPGSFPSPQASSHCVGDPLSTSRH